MAAKKKPKQPEDRLKPLEKDDPAATRKVTWRRYKFEIEPMDTWVVKFSHHAERDRLTLALEAALGAANYTKFIEADPSPTLREAEGLISTITSAFGVTPGE